MKVAEIASGLWTWTGLHPDWTPDDGGPGGWEQEVGCVYYEAPNTVVLVDPLIPPEDRERFLDALDRDVERLGQPVRVLLTLESHRRSSDAIAERYKGTIGGLPDGVEAAASAQDELVLWIPEHRTLVFGDLMLGREGGLRLPRTWIGKERYTEVVEALRPLLELPAERALVAHGVPVLAGARDALEHALKLPRDV